MSPVLEIQKKYMPIVLVVEPHFVNTDALSRCFDHRWKVLRAETPAKAVAAVQAARFDVVAVPGARADGFSYASLYSTLRLVAPGTPLMTLGPQTSAC